MLDRDTTARPMRGGAAVFQRCRNVEFCECSAVLRDYNGAAHC
jgi:hypothetical protein